MKAQIVKERAYKSSVLVGEAVAEFSYQPNPCDQSYRLVVGRKPLSVPQGEKVLFAEGRSFFSIPNRADRTGAQVVELAHQRCHQENVIAQLKGAGQARRMPGQDLNSHRAYRVLATLAWNLKAWFALLGPDRARGLELLPLAFRPFLQAIMARPAQLVRTARKLGYRGLGDNRRGQDFLAPCARLRRLAPRGWRPRGRRGPGARKIPPAVCPETV